VRRELKAGNDPELMTVKEMKVREALPFGMIFFLLWLPSSAMAQGPGQVDDGLPVSSQAPPKNAPEGIEKGGYRIQQSVELGYRVTDLTGSAAMYDTLINLQTGPRILDQSVSMQSLAHDGFFDSLTGSSFGWGGDPSNAARLRLVKYKLYNFTASFRRDQNYFNYNLFANPLNPPTATPVVNVNNSPHAYYNARRMYDFGLTLFPQQRFSILLDYNRNRVDGPSFSSVHEGTEALLYQPLSTTLDAYRFGVSWRANRHTTANFIENIQTWKGDTDYFLSPFNSVPLANGTPVEFGLPWFNSGSPCATPIIGGVANPSCNGYLSYTRTQRVSTTIPTEQATLQSSSIKKLDVTAKFSYSNAQSSTPLLELFNGFISRTGERVIDTAGSQARASWISVVADAGATYHISDRLRLVDTFRFRNYQVPGLLNLLQVSLFNASTVALPGSMLFPPVTYPGTLPLHSSGSPADSVNETYNRFLGQGTKENEFDVQYDVKEYAGLYVGWRYSHIRDHNFWTSIANADIFYPPMPNRGNCAGIPLNPDGSCTFTGLFDSEDDLTIINENTALAGVWLKPNQNLNINGDAEMGYADNFLTRIDPRHIQRYRAQANYTPRPWLNVGANLNILEEGNHTGDINYDMHNRTFGVNGVIAPKEVVSFDFAYNFSAFQQSNNICFIGTLVPAGSFTCNNDPTLLETLGNYNSHTNYGEFSVVLKPEKRVAARVGYSITNVSGSTLILNTLQPLGPLASRLQQPLAAVDVEIAKNFTWHGGWNYYQYGEGSFVGPTLPRYFHANVATLSLKYAF
jgi:hypothetical protein